MAVLDEPILTRDEYLPNDPVPSPRPTFLSLQAYEEPCKEDQSLIVVALCFVSFVGC